MSDITKDCSQIWMRLFDHRPFLSGEIKFMLREFEEKRSDREVTNLFSALENATEIKDNQVERMKENAAFHLPELATNVEKALSAYKLIESLKEELSEDKTLERKREVRKKEWTRFSEEMSDTYTRIDNAFEQKEEELKDFYADLEHKLNITTK